MDNLSFYAGGFFWRPKKREVFLHLRDSKTDIHPNQWGFFGGTSEDGETPLECFIRELREETGYESKPEEVKYLSDYFNKQRGTHRYVFYIEKDIDKSELSLGEGADFEWIPLDKLGQYDLTEKTKMDLDTFCKSVLK